MGGNMKRLLELHYDEVSKNPLLDFEKIRKTKYLHEFDREVQGPTWGYPTEGAYYRDASSVDGLFAVRIPLFAINAKDDPVSFKPLRGLSRRTLFAKKIHRLLSMSQCPTKKLNRRLMLFCV
jgi:predicted alpha/beta-fold hydrolase